MAYFSSRDQLLESVKQEMMFQHLTQETLGMKAGYSRKAINHILNHPETLTFGQLDAITNALRIEVRLSCLKK